MHFLCLRVIDLYQLWSLTQVINWLNIYSFTYPATSLELNLQHYYFYHLLCSHPKIQEHFLQKEFKKLANKQTFNSKHIQGKSYISRLPNTAVLQFLQCHLNPPRGVRNSPFPFPFFSHLQSPTMPL